MTFQLLLLLMASLYWKRSLFTLLLCLLFLFNSPLPVPAKSLLSLQQQAGNSKNREILVLGKTIERELKGGETHSYIIALNTGEYLHTLVQQKGIDVVVLLFSPEGRQIIEVDSPNGTYGPEPIYFIAETAGLYRLDVHSLVREDYNGLYSVTVAELAEATPQHRKSVIAQQLFIQAEELRYQKSFKEAIEKYLASLTLWQETHIDERVATTLNTIGEIFIDQNNPKEAFTYYDKALALARKTTDRPNEAVSLLGMGRINYYSGNLESALQCYRDALILLRRIGDQGNAAVVLTFLGEIYTQLGEHQQALNQQIEALNVFQALKDINAEANTLNNIGVSYAYLGKIEIAIDYFKKALKIYRAIGNKASEVNVLSRIVLMYNSTNDIPQVIDSLTEVLSLYKGMNNPDQKMIVITLDHIGSLYKNLGAFMKALDYYQQALELAETIQNPLGVTLVWGNIAEVYYLLGDQEKALQYCNKKLAAEQAFSDKLKGSGLGYDSKMKTLFLMARIKKESGKLDEALNYIKATIVELESLRANIIVENLLISNSENTQDYYEFYINLLMTLHRLDPSKGYDAWALEVNERARAYALLKLLNEARIDINQGIDPKLFQKKLNLQRLLSKEAASITLISTTPELDQLIVELDQIEARIRKENPNYAALKLPQPLNFTEIRRLLDTDTLLLEYHLGKERSYIWAVTSDTMASFELPTAAEIEVVASRVYKLLTEHVSSQEKSRSAKNTKRTPLLGHNGRLEFVKKTDAEYFQASATLSKMILGPIAELLGKKRLVIVSDGALQLIPFSALPVPQTNIISATTPSLFNQHEIVHNPSISVLSILREQITNRKAAPKTMFLIADPVFSKKDVRVVGKGRTKLIKVAFADNELDKDREEDLPLATRDPDPNGNFPRLENSYLEAQAIYSLIPSGEGRLVLGFDASKEALINNDTTNYRYLHFSTHAVTNNDYPQLSGLVLSLVDRNGKKRDGFLRLQDIYNLKLSADLVVLGACQTAVGKNVRGEGLISLTRGFMYAGAPRIVASLWKVNDSATAQFMKLFYIAILKNGLNPIAALREAQ
ncbi:MAG: CHAT domain-containing tetratricopeptide repeat protein, partial [Acidobacteriota bacterium]